MSALVGRWDLPAGCTASIQQADHGVVGVSPTFRRLDNCVGRIDGLGPVGTLQ